MRVAPRAASTLFLEAVARLLQVLGSLNGHLASVESVGFCDVLPYAASGSLDGQVILWDVQVRAAAPPATQSTARSHPCCCARRWVCAKPASTMQL